MKEISVLISELILQTQGIDLSKYDSNFLNKSIQKRMVETRCQSTGSYLDFIQYNSAENELFVNSLCVSYSEFFRNPLTFSVLERVILPAIMMNKINSKRKEIRIWSAACAAGQETYSLAILLKEFSISVGKKINFRIFATDQSDQQINEAQHGVYSDCALNNVTLKRLNQWFVKQDHTYQIKQELKENIDFSVFDLFCEEHSSPPSSIFGDFDLVMCANLLFYYHPDFRIKILNKTSQCLSKTGFLITSETERDILNHYGFNEVYPQSAIFGK
jgi:chemotaxis methyl-accepting protein methylase